MIKKIDTLLTLKLSDNNQYATRCYDKNLLLRVFHFLTEDLSVIVLLL